MLKPVLLIVAMLATTACGITTPTGPSTPTVQASAPIEQGCLQINRDPRVIRATSFVVLFQRGTDANATVADLSARYQFQPTQVYLSLSGFSAKLNSAMLKGLACEPVVRSIELVSPIFILQ